MRSRTIVLLMAAIMTTLMTPAAYAQSCQQLWVERNSYYKARGYCFKTERAISYFGNGGCIYQDEDRVPLTQRERNRIAEIKRLERARGCD
jgi:YARHG domain-containing protein